MNAERTRILATATRAGESKRRPLLFLSLGRWVVHGGHGDFFTGQVGLQDPHGRIQAGRLAIFAGFADVEHTQRTLHTIRLRYLQVHGRMLTEDEVDGTPSAIIPVFPKIKLTMATTEPVSGSSSPVGQKDPVRFKMVSIEHMGP